MASNSPRRRELLAGLGIPYEVRIVSGIDESYPAEMDVAEVPQYISQQKAHAYTLTDSELLITADTIVCIDNEILGKPKDDADARLMLNKLSGRTH